jgi:hypothetical protein
MAKITPGPLITEARGKVGDTVFTRTRGGLVARALKVEAAAVGPHNLLSVSHLDTTPATPPVRGDLITGQAVAPLWKRLAKGTPGQVLGCDADDTKWVNPPAAGVTSVGLVLPAEFDVTGSPVTAAGDLTGAWSDQAANKVFAGPTTGAADTPAFRALVAADLPTPATIAAEFNITEAQIKAWNATPIQLIAAPGANKIIRVIDATWLLKYTAPVYATMNGNVELTTWTAAATLGQVIRLASDILNHTADRTIFQPCGTTSFATTGYTNLPLYLWGTHATQPTNGNSTLRLNILYRILTVP